MEPDPFPGLKIDSFEFLKTMEARSECPKCNKTRKYYCYNCYVPVKNTQDQVPKVNLPIQVDVIKHPQECDGKSTAAHAGVLAPDHVTVYTYPVIPDYKDKDKVLLVFPGENSKSIEHLAKQFYDSTDTEDCSDNKCNPGKEEQDAFASDLKLSETDSGKRKLEAEELTAVKRLKPLLPELPFNRVVFIDSTWNQTKKIFLDERLRGLQQVELKSENTRFWRHQRDKPRSYLATIEAIYFFLKDFHENFISKNYEGQYDNLLFFFCFVP